VYYDIRLYNFDFEFCIFSYAREFQAKLRELQDSKAAAAAAIANNCKKLVQPNSKDHNGNNQVNNNSNNCYKNNNNKITAAITLTKQS
jgi:hypothetical protein